MTHTGIRLPLISLTGALLLVGLLLSLDRAQQAHGGGATFTVTASTAEGKVNASDAITPNAFCTLREAMKAARENTMIAECGPDSGFSTELDTITFEADPGTLTFQLVAGSGADAGDLNAGGGPILIEHTGVGFVSISGNTATNILHVDAGDEVTVRDITLRDGWETTGCGGAALFSNGDVTLDKVTMLGNSTATTIGLASTICAAGDLTITGGTIFNNFANATDGALMRFSGNTLNITNTLISENTPGKHSGVWVFGPGGGSTVNVTNSTIAATDGGILVHASGQSTVNLLNTTLKLTGAAALVEASGTSVVTAKNTIFSSDSGCGATVTDNGNNLDTGNDCGLSLASDSLINADPMLGPITGLPGWGTSLYPLETGSEAIDAGTNTGCPATDQRGVGFDRPLDGNSDSTATCDIGAYEAPEGTNPSPAPTPTPVTATPTQPATPTDTPAATTAAPTQTATATPAVTASPTPVSTGPTATLAQNPLQGDIDCDDDIDNADFMLLLLFLAGLAEADDVPGCFDIGEFESNSQRGWGDVNCDDPEDELDALFIVAYLAEVILEQGAFCFPIGEHMT